MPNTSQVVQKVGWCLTVAWKLACDGGTSIEENVHYFAKVISRVRVERYLRFEINATE
jgi:hypothetical protein